MRRTDFSDMACSIAKTLEIVGEWWTPLILRDLVLGLSQFDEIQTDLGISSNVLSDRLKGLIDHGVIERRPYGSHPDRHEYLLTPKGRDAIPILLALLAWGDKWEAGRPGPPTQVVHLTCGRATAAVAHCSECGEKLETEDLAYHKGPGSRRGRGTELIRDYLAPAVG